MADTQRVVQLDRKARVARVALSALRVQPRTEMDGLRCARTVDR
jgi:hypothetical protein